MIRQSKIAAPKRTWRNWQTRTAKDRVGDLAGSSPVVRTNQKTTHMSGLLFYLFISSSPSVLRIFCLIALSYQWQYNLNGRYLNR